MADLPKTPLVQVLEWLEQFLRNNWSGLAVLLWGYEERKVDAAKQAQADAVLKQKEAENESAVLKKYDGMSDADVLHKFGKGSGDSSTNGSS